MKDPFSWNPPWFSRKHPKLQVSHWNTQTSKITRKFNEKEARGTSYLSTSIFMRSRSWRSPASRSGFGASLILAAPAASAKRTAFLCFTCLSFLKLGALSDCHGATCLVPTQSPSNGPELKNWTQYGRGSLVLEKSIRTTRAGQGTGSRVLWTQQNACSCRSPRCRAIVEVQSLQNHSLARSPNQATSGLWHFAWNARWHPSQIPRSLVTVLWLPLHLWHLAPSRAFHASSVKLALAFLVLFRGCASWPELASSSRLRPVLSWGCLKLRDRRLPWDEPCSPLRERWPAMLKVKVAISDLK